MYEQKQFQDKIITAKSVSKVYKKNFRSIHALEDLSFEVFSNQILGILGPNGAGKTTLLKILTGIIPKGRFTGDISIFNTEDTNSIKHKIGFLPESPEFFKNITASELLDFALRISGNLSNTKTVDDMLKHVNLFHERNEKIKNFSKGMRQRIGIAQAIIHSPELLILDEPMSGLDPQGRRMVIDLIHNYSTEGKTILFSTHDLDDIEALCTHVLVLVKGKILLQKSLNELRANSSFLIETESNEGKSIYKAENSTAFWEHMYKIRKESNRIIRVQSGITEQLEQYYREENEVGEGKNEERRKHDEKA